jgi:chlorobactene glucosyltransferase
LNLTLIPRLDPRVHPATTPLASIVIPARNEAGRIEATVRAFLAQEYPSFEVIVVNDRSTDETGAVLGRIHDPRLVVIDGAEPPDGWLGKPWALDQGTRRAAGEILLISDADILYAPESLRSAVAEIQRDDSALIAIFPRFDMQGFGEHVGMGMLPFALILFPVWLFNRWQHPRVGMGAGAGNVVRRSALEGIEFFAKMRDAVVDDIALAQNLRRAGGRTHAVLAHDLVRVRMYHGAQQVVEGFTKNVFPGMGRHYSFAAVMLGLMIVLHLFPYAYAFTGDRYAIATVILISVTRVVAFGGTRHSLLNAIFLHPLMVVFWCWILIRSVWITGVRKQVHWRGRVYDARHTRFGSER